MTLRPNSRLIFTLATLCLLLLALAGATQARALDPAKAFSQYAQTTWAHQNGLAPKMVMAVTQTADGFLWLATEQGLVRFDGVTFVTYDERNAPNLGDRFIRSVAPDPDGSLWIGTMSGIAHYSHGRFEDCRRQTGYRNDVYDISPDGAGGVWFSSESGLHHSLHGVNRVYTVADGLPSSGITGLARGGDGALWVGTTRGLARLQNGSLATWSDWPAARKSPINTVSVGLHGVVWVGLMDGTVGRWSEGHFTTWWEGEQARGKPVECIREDRDGTLWVAIKRLGLVRVRDKAVEILTQSAGLPSNNPDWVFEDRENSLWVGWADAGVSMIRDTRFTTFGKPEGLSSDEITSVAQAADGGLWIGTGDAGLDHLKGSAVQVLTRANGLGDNGILGLLQQRDGTLWMGSDSGKITRWKDGRARVLTIARTALVPGTPSMVEDRTGQVWFGIDMPGGLSRLRGDHFEPVGIPGLARVLAFAPDGALWVASYQVGLIRYKDGHSIIYTEADGLPSLALTSVYVEPDGTVWAGTTLSGIVRWRHGRITRYASGQGLFDNAVGGIMADNQGYLWMAGSRGIWRVSRHELDEYADGRLAAVHSEVYGYGDGLRSLQTSFAAQPAVLKDQAGRLWFATSGGLSMIDPAHILSNTVAPQASIESVLFGGKQAPLGSGGFRPPPGASPVEIAFTAPGFVAPDVMQFRYRLDGGAWIDFRSDAGHARTVAFSRLRPGRYHFELQAANHDGVWSVGSATVDFVLTAHFYQTLWFDALLALGLFLCAWTAYVARIRYLVRKNENLEETVSRRTAEVRVALEAAEQAKELLREQATKDSLTGLWNRRAIFEILETELRRCQQERKPFCVLMVDADHFKNINDTFGHLAGDRIIQEIAARLRQGLRQREAIGRYGGEELLVVLPECPFSTSLTRAEQLRAAIEDRPVLYDKQEIWVTCSFGLAQVGEATSTPELIGEADEALYSAKKAGRNCVRPQPVDALPAGPLSDHTSVLADEQQAGSALAL